MYSMQSNGGINLSENATSKIGANARPVFILASVIAMEITKTAASFLDHFSRHLFI